MAWIEVHQTLPTHRKIKKLKRLLKIKTPQAVGHMVMLWLWAIDNAPDGNLDRLDAEDIAEAAEWTGEADRFLSALAESGFVDGGDTLSIHDWNEFAGFLADKREVKKSQNRERQKRYRQKAKSVTETPEDALPVTPHNADATRYGSVTQALRNAPNLTLPNLTSPNHGNGSNKPSVETRDESVTPPPSGAVRAYMDRISATPSSSSMVELLAFERELGTEVCLRAIDRALDANAHNWPYVKTVLQAWREAGVKSPADLDRMEAKRQESKRRKTSPAGASADGPVDMGDLEWMLNLGEETGQDKSAQEEQG